jgi:hypothetical protein
MKDLTPHSLQMTIGMNHVPASKRFHKWLLGTALRCAPCSPRARRYAIGA